MPAVVNKSVGSPSGASGDEGTTVWPRAAKKSRKRRRSSLDVRGCMRGSVADWPPTSLVEDEEPRVGAAVRRGHAGEIHAAAHRVARVVPPVPGRDGRAL